MFSNLPSEGNYLKTGCKKLVLVFVYDNQGLIEKNNLVAGNVNTPGSRYILGYYTFYRLLTFRSKLDINLFWGGFYCNISYCNTLKMKKDLLLFVLLSFCITLIN